MARRASLLLLLAGCGTLVTPDAVREADWPAEEKVELDRRWHEAVRLANAFLASADNKSLPHGRICLHDDVGMKWHDPPDCRPLRVKNTWWGDLCVWSGFAAQERSWGFVVGDRGDGPQAVAHSLFYADGGAMKPPVFIAELVLHELAHMVHHEGTVDFFHTVGYYWQAIWHGGGREHPAEQLPYATSDEFMNWAISAG